MPKGREGGRGASVHGVSEPARVSVEVADAVGTIRLEDPDTRNALTNETLRAIAAALAELDTIDYYFGERARLWDDIRNVGLPVIAAVSGFCLGAGCELALMSDI